MRPKRQVPDSQRDRPRSASSRNSTRRRGLAYWLGRAWAHWTYARHVEPHWLEVTRWQLPLANWPEALDGLRIAHLTDFHVGRRVPLSLLVEAVDLANAQKPHLIALTGDFVHAGRGYVEQVAEVLSRLRAPLGVVAVLGNHDFAKRTRLGWAHSGLPLRIEAALRQRGVRVLRNEAWQVERNGAAFYVVGVDDLWSGRCDVQAAFRGIPAQAPCLLLAHHPQTIERLAGHRAILTLSGHTHGGQVNWPGLGPLFLGGKMRRWATGLFHQRNGWLYVNRGVGYGLRLRYRARPEVAVFTLLSRNENRLAHGRHL
ncbi:3',5'-cyclic adenosine monophosphate phosphodiesterase CpdA [bacterium HR36]|uniref:Metallophosphoesterase n=1 Tax=uncultured Planctomycetota bacterium TaxID=120965 RepID=H5SCP9_9BACT|nr:metallophosphoesterase [uncultured Planctomycetota bacterium]GBD37009.1 3',5'-cyclic adenosine monophosphate phosphodiesterase CpdA [bacterium HR36]